MAENRRRYGASLDRPRRDRGPQQVGNVAQPPQVQPRRTNEATRIVGASGAIITGNQTITGTLTVTGAVTFQSTLGVTGLITGTTANFSGAVSTGALSVTGVGTFTQNNANSEVFITATGSGQYSILNFGDESDDNVGMIRYDHNDNILAFFINAGNKASFNNAGKLTLTNNLILPNLGEFSTAATSVDLDVLQYDGGASLWKPTAFIKPVSDGDVLAEAYTDGTASSHIDTLNGTYSGDPSTGTVGIPTITPIYKGFQIDTSGSSALPTNTVYSIEWSSDSGVSWSGTGGDYIRTDGRQCIHSGLAIDGTTYRYRVSIHGTGGVDAGPSATTSDTLPLATPEVFTKGIVLASQISTVDLASLSANFGTVTISTTGSLSSGQTAYDTGTGFWLEANSGTPRFSIGDAGANALTWNGTTLTITGTVAATNFTGATAVFTGNVGIGVTPISGARFQTQTTVQQNGAFSLVSTLLRDSATTNRTGVQIGYTCNTGSGTGDDTWDESIGVHINVNPTSITTTTGLKVSTSTSTGTSGITITGFTTALDIVDGAFLTDTISEHTSAAGVTIDGLLIKDGGILEALTVTEDAVGESDVIILQNLDTTAATQHSSNILFNLATTAAATVGAGVIKVEKIQEWTSTASTQDARMKFRLAVDGTITDAMTLDHLGGLTTFGQIAAPASTTSVASFSVPHGTAPTSPTNGDMWTTTSGLFVRINGSTIGPLS